MTKLDFGSWGLQLKGYLKEINDPRKDDHAFINERGDAAAGEFEAARREGCNESQALERAHHVLMAGL